MDNIGKMNDILLKNQDIGCPNVDILNMNMVNLSLLYDQYPNIEADKTYTCLISSALKDFTGNKDNALEKLKIFFSKYPNFTDNLDIRYYPDINDFYNQAISGIAFLNKLRIVTPNFKYIYYANIPSKIIIQESRNTVPLGSVMRVLSADKNGKNMAKSLLLQLLVAVTHAHSEGVSNFPFVIECKEVNPLALLPIYNKDSVEYIKTFGFLSIFSSYTTCAYSNLIYTSGNTLNYTDELENIYKNFLFVLKKENIGLFNLFTEQRQSDIDYSDIIQNGADPKFVIQCIGNAHQIGCYTLDFFMSNFTYTKSHIQLLVDSYVNRIDYLLLILANENIAANQLKSYLIMICITEYIKMINELKNNMSPDIQKEVFRPRRYSTMNHSAYRKLDNTTLLSDNEFIKIVSNLSIKSLNIDFLSFKTFSTSAVNEARKTKPEDINLQKLSLQTMLEVYINNLRRISYYRTTDNILNEYSKLYNTTVPNFNDCIEKAKLINTKIDEFMQLNKLKDDQINDSKYIVWYLIYKNLFKIDRDTEDKINDMYLGFSPAKRNEIIGLYEKRTKIASDPILLIENNFDLLQ